MAADNLSTVTRGTPNAPTVTPGQEIDAATFQSMLNVLQELVNHTHLFYDDYATACNCNCNCNCTRGSL